MDFWFAPDLNADLVPLVTDVAAWEQTRARISTLQIYQGCVQAQHENELNVGPNYYPRLVEDNFFLELLRFSRCLAIEAAAVKAWTPDGIQAADNLRYVIDQVRAAGGEVHHISFDEPLMGRLDCNPPVSFDDCVTATKRCVHQAVSQNVPAGLITAYPATPVSDVISFCEQISPTFLHVDIDQQACGNLRRSQIETDLRRMVDQCRAWGLPFGMILHGQRGDTPETYHDEALSFQKWVFKRLGRDHRPDRCIVQSWKQVPLPVTLPETTPLTHTALFNELYDLTV